MKVPKYTVDSLVEAIVAEKPPWSKKLVREMVESLPSLDAKGFKESAWMDNGDVFWVFGRIPLDWTGADVGMGINGATPLHWAAWWGKTKAIKILLAAGADAAAVDYYGNMPWRLADYRGYRTVAKLLKKATKTPGPGEQP